MNVLTDQSQSTMLVIFKLRAKKKKGYLANSLQVYKYTLDPLQALIRIY